MSAKLASLKHQIKGQEQAIAQHKHRLAQQHRTMQQHLRNRLATPAGVAIAFFCGLTVGWLKDGGNFKRLCKERLPETLRPLLMAWLNNQLRAILPAGAPPSSQSSCAHPPDSPENGPPPGTVSASTPFGDHNRPVNLSRRLITVSASGTFLLLCCYILYLLAPFLIPISLAVLFSLLFKPIITRLRNLRIPAPIGAACSVLFLLSIMLAGLYTLSQPALEWADKAPVIIKEFAAKLESFSKPLVQDMSGAREGIRQPLRDIQQTTEKVEQLASPSPDGAKSGPVAVTIQQPGLPARLLIETPAILLGIGIFFVMLYFLLATSDALLTKTVKIVPHIHDKKKAVRIIHHIQRDTSHYLLTMLTINIVLGTVSSIALILLGIPNALLWGVLIGLLNFAPYLGPLTSITLLTVIAILALETPLEVLMVTLTLAILQILEGQFITPHIMGRQFALSPTLVFLSILFWGGIWGVAGALIAVPLLVSFKVICENVPPLHPVARLIER